MALGKGEWTGRSICFVWSCLSEPLPPQQIRPGKPTRMHATPLVKPIYEDPPPLHSTTLGACTWEVLVQGEGGTKLKTFLESILKK